MEWLTDIVIVMAGPLFIIMFLLHGWRFIRCTNDFLGWLEIKHPKQFSRFAKRNQMSIRESPYSWISLLKILKFLYSNEDFNDPEVKVLKIKMFKHHNIVLAVFFGFFIMCLVIAL